MLCSIMSLALAMAPMRSLAPRFSVFRPAASFVPMLATHGGMATGMHGYMGCESAEPGPDTNCQADVQHMRHLSSKPYLEKTCCGAAPGACPESSHGHARPPWPAAVSAVANAPGPIEAVPHSTCNEADAFQLKTSRMPRVPVGRSTRGRTPLALPRQSHGPTIGRRLTSCCMKAGDLGPYNEPIQPQLPKRPCGARYLLSRSDADTLIVTLPPRGIKEAISLQASVSALSAESGFMSQLVSWVCVSQLVYWACVVACGGPLPDFFADFSLAAEIRLLDFLIRLLDFFDVKATYAPVVYEGASYAIFGCAGASWLAARAFTTATLSVGEFQWEYKETIAGIIPTCYRQGSVEELDICLQDKQCLNGEPKKQLTLITGLKMICIGGSTQVSKEESAWVFNSVELQIAAINRQESLPAALKSGFFLSLQSTIDNMLSK